jgi:hypothetical protein
MTTALLVGCRGLRSTMNSHPVLAFEDMNGPRGMDFIEMVLTVIGYGMKNVRFLGYCWKWEDESVRFHDY